VLKLATADPARVEREVREYDKDPAAYIQRRFTELSEWDFPVWCAATVWIKTKAGQRVRFNLNRPQRRMWDWLLEDLNARRPVRWFVLKARQQGVSTFWIAFFLWLTTLRPNREALICAHKESSTYDFNNRLRAMYTQLHPTLKPGTHTNKRDLVYFSTNTHERRRGAGIGLESKLVFSTAQTGELGRSYNFHAVLLSEFAIWPELKIDVKSQMGGLQQVMSDDAGTILILESTAKSHNEATEWWTEADNGYRKVFIPHCAFDEYRSRPLKYDKLKELCASDDERYGNEIEESRLIAEALPVWYPDEVEAGGPEWIEEEVRNRLHWRRRTIDTKCMGDLRVFRHEYPTCPEHALTTEAKNAFDHLSLADMAAAVKEEAIPVVRAKLIQDDDEEHPNRKFYIAPGYGKINFYRYPDEFAREDVSFVIGADTSMGLSAGADPSAAVTLATYPDGSAEEVASYNGVIAPDDFAEILNWLGRFYAYRLGDGALIGVEHNEEGGAVVNHLLQKRWRYPKLYYAKDMFTGKTKRDSVPGFVTHSHNKSGLITFLAEDIRNRSILFRSLKLIEQLKSYQELPNGKYGPAPGSKHKDDFVSAAMIARYLKTQTHRYIAPREVMPRGSFAWEAHRLAQQRGIRVPGV
jgi:hypothetical protein